MTVQLRQAIERYKATDSIASLSLQSTRRVNRILDILAGLTGPTTQTGKLDRSDFDRCVNVWRATSEISTLNLYRGSLRMFGRWLHENGYTRTDLACHLRNQRPTVHIRKRQPLDRNEVTKLLAIARERHPRDGMTVLILLTTGLRESEVCGLRWDGITSNGEILVYRPKIRDFHCVPMSNQLAEAMNVWRGDPLWPSVPRSDVFNSAYVVPALAYGAAPMRPDWPLSTRRQTGLSLLLKGFMAEAGVTDLDGKGTHTLRRTSASLLVGNGASIEDAQRLLGHASPAQTMAYLSVDQAAQRLADRVKGWTV